jgi:crotonobetainyl-CoA:carnitine CoA-transferase CaiB-like acyl-CoA transferase
MEKVGTMSETRPFDGVRVIDLTHVLAGPFCTYQLALLGADTIKIESPHEGDIVRESGPKLDMNRRGMGTSFLTQNSNKRCITLDIKTRKGRDVLKRLASRADVFVENYRVGALASLGLGQADLRALNPRLIYCSMTGFGQTGPKAPHNAYDQVIQGICGLMSMTGVPGSSPWKAGGPIIDYAAGLSAAFAISSALYLRNRTGQGQYIDCAMFDAAMMLIASLITSHLVSGDVPKPKGNDLDQAGVSGYQTKSGVLMIGCFNARQNRRFWTAVGRPDLAELGSLELQGKNRDKLAAAFRDVFMTRTAEEWEQFFIEIGVPAARVRNLKEAVSLEQVAHRNLLHRFAEVPGVEGPITVPVASFKFENGGPRVDTPPHLMGADTDAVLGELGIGKAEIAAMRAEKVI